MVFDLNVIYLIMTCAVLLVSVMFIMRLLRPDISSEIGTEETLDCNAAKAFAPDDTKEKYRFVPKPPHGRPSHCLCLVIPAYNEEERLPIMLDQTFTFLRSNRDDISNLCHRAMISSQEEKNGKEENGSAQRIRNDKIVSSFEIIVVDDGSDDNTVDVAKNYSDKLTEWGTKDVLRLVKMNVNSGKGAAIRAGMLRNDADFCLMVDADGATNINDLMKLLDKMASIMSGRRRGREIGVSKDIAYKYGVPALVIGSRASLEQSSQVERSKIRALLAFAFNFAFRNLCSDRVRDSQCGFKLFSRDAAYKLFTNLHLTRWAFDIEIIYIADHLNFDLAEVSVDWKEVAGSKLATSKVALALIGVSMLKDMVWVKTCYESGAWKIK